MRTMDLTITETLGQTSTSPICTASAAWCEQKDTDAFKVSDSFSSTPGLKFGFMLQHCYIGQEGPLDRPLCGSQVACSLNNQG